MSIDDIVEIEEREVKEEERKKSIVYDDSYRNQTPLNIIMTDAELVPLPEGVYGMHVVETGKNYINQILRGNVMQRYRTEIHEQLHKVMKTADEYVVRTLEAWISGMNSLKNRYDRIPRYIS